MNRLLSQGFLQSLRLGPWARAWNGMSKALMRALGPRFAALISYLSIDWDPKRRDATILAFYRESFIKDVNELRKRTDLDITVVQAGFTRFQSAWFPLAMQEQTFYQSHQGPGRERALAKSQLYARTLVKLIQRRQGVIAILSANFDYWQEVGLKAVAQEMGIPFVVLSREHPVIPKVCQIVDEWYRRSAYRFSGDLIAVAGQSSLDVFSQIPSICTADKIVVTGLPRFDAWRDVDVSTPWHQRSWVTLLTFTEGYFADQTFQEVLRTFCAAARQCTLGYQFVVKCKDMHDLHAIKSLMTADELQHVRLTHEDSLFDVLPRSRLVVNYNSLSLVEAALAGCRLLIPAWGECQSEGPEAMYSRLDPAVAALVEYAESPQEMASLLSLDPVTRATSWSPDKAHQFVNRFVRFDPNESCSQRFASLLDRVIRARHAGSTSAPMETRP